MSGENDANGLFGFGGNDTLLAGPGDADFLQGGPGDDILDGGPGDGDTADYLSVPNPTGPVQVDLVVGSAAGHGTDSILEIEKVNGTDDNDTISGNDFGNTLFGFKGDDIMSGFAADDFLVGREGFDTLDGGEGIDDCLDGESNTNCEFEKRRFKDVRVPTTVSWSNALRTSVSTKESAGGRMPEPRAREVKQCVWRPVAATSSSTSNVHSLTMSAACPTPRRPLAIDVARRHIAT